MFRRQRIALLVALVSLLFLSEVSWAGATQSSTEGDVAASAEQSTAPAELTRERRVDILGASWGRSTDRAVVTSGDATGFHVLRADAVDGYRWRTIASLSEPGFETDAWIGNICVTASGRRAVIVYAPRTFTNRADLADRGGFVAVVDLDSGAVTKLRIQASLAYFNPGCGHDETAVLTQGPGEDLNSTRLVVLDTVRGRLAAPIEVPGQLTSSVPTADGIVAADSGALVHVDRSGQRRVLAGARGVPFRVSADADGGVVFMQREKADQASVRRVDPSKQGSARISVLATGELTALNVTSGRGGHVFVTGTKATAAASTPGSVAIVDVSASAVMSLSGELAVISVARTNTPDPRAPRSDPSRPQQLEITAQALRTGRQFPLTTVPGGSGGDGGTPSPALGLSDKARSSQAEGDPHDPADGDQRTCSVARNDPANQAMQPKPRQIEWAVDQAVRGALTVQRPANWKNLGMPAYTPQGLFPSRSLVGGGNVPAQVLLGIAAQESNMWQAARYAVPGVTANPLIGNYFGIDYYNDDESDDWSINWAEADCGYGVTQVTDGMRRPGMGQDTMPYSEQRAVALDFAANVAKGLQILQDKWNQTRSAGLKVNNGDASRIENWFFAVWAYNSGFYPDTGGPWGVGWLNNPVNPRYPANRAPFLELTYEDAAHPQDWPYPEKVMGWAGHPIEAIETPGNLVAGYRPAWWLTETDRWKVKPPVTQFCDATNDCEPGAQHKPNDPDVIGEPAGPCAHRNGAGEYDLKCWYHAENTWKPDCANTCGHELLRFDPGYAYQEDATSYPPVCTTNGLPSNALIVDNVPQSVPSVRPGCTKPASSGTFTFTFGVETDGTYPGKIDVHQIGAAYGAHFWMSNTHKDRNREALGTWKLNRTHTGPMKIMAHVPDPGARTNVAEYRINAVGGERRQVVRQGGTGNRWVPIGTYMFQNAVPTVSLSSLLPENRVLEGADSRIAWDAMAFIPIDGIYHEEVVEAVAVFDENQNIDTSAPGSWFAGPLASRQDLYDWATEKAGDVLAVPDCGTGAPEACLKPSVRGAMTRWRDTVVASGTDPVNHPPGQSIARWIRFAQPYTDRPTSDVRPDHFDDPDRYKIKSRTTVSFVSANGQVVPGSEFVAYDHRTGNTHLPPFVTEFMKAIDIDYGIAEPDLRYRMRDLNVHDAGYTSVNPLLDGRLPGRAYANGGIAPELVNNAGAPSDNPTCVRMLSAHGGSIGYRPMLSQAGPMAAADDWVYRLGQDARVPVDVYQLAVDIRDLFFDDAGGSPLTGSSIFVDAPPIWQELYFLVCADSTVRPGTPDHPILRASYMPDQYLYRNGRAIDQDGAFTRTHTPLSRGDFYTFSNLPQAASENPFRSCTGQSNVSRKGNPWEINQYTPSRPGVNPDFWQFCNLAATPDESHSSMHGALDG